MGIMTRPCSYEKQKILHCRNKMKNKNYYTVRTKWKTKNTTLSDQNEKQKFHTAGTKWKTKNTTLSEQNEKQKNTTL